jgi:hypothetical protein
VPQGYSNVWDGNLWKTAIENFRLNPIDLLEAFSKHRLRALKCTLRHPTYYGRFDNGNKIRIIDCRMDRFKMSCFEGAIRGTIAAVRNL